MKYNKLLNSCAAVALVVPGTAIAQDGDIGLGGEQDVVIGRDDIVVVAQRIRGQVDTDIAPILELDEADIAAYGAGSIADLLAAIEPETGSSRGRGDGRPLFLINGIRVGSFREFRSYPPEAVRKVEVLPEEVAQKLGFAPDRRVVNFILKDNYSAITAEGEYEQPAIGGYSRTEQEATVLKITGGGRINLNVELSDVSLLTEAERDIIQTPGSISDVATDPDPAAFRSLVSDSAQIEATANYAKAFIESGSSISVNGTFNRLDSRSLSGLDTVVLTDDAGNSALRTFGTADPLERRSRSDTFSTSASYNRPFGQFKLTATADGNYSDTQTQIDRRADTSGLIVDAAAGILAIDGALPDLPDAGFDTADRRTYVFDSKITLAGSPIILPAGEVSTTFDLGYKWNRIESEDTRAATANRLTRGNLSGGINVSVPITSSRDDVLAALGSITLNGQFGIDEVSDFGTLLRWSGGVNWSLTDSLDLQATYVWREVQPSLSDLGNPQITNFNVPTFDFATGDTALVTVTSGGNPTLLAETQSDWSFSANWKLPFIDNTRLRVDYSRNQSDNVSSSFPFLTPEIEAAFPDRVVRDASRRLTALDLRPVDFFQTRSERMTFGLSTRGSFGKARPQDAVDAASDGRAKGRPPRGDGRDPGANGPGSGDSPRGPLSNERRERMMAFRERVCADDGEAFLLRLIEAAERGETLEELPDFNPEIAQRMLSRVRNEDGTINRELLTGFRTRMCSNEGGPPGAVGAQQVGGSPNAARGRGVRSGNPFSRGGDGRGRFFFNLSHSIELNREVLIAPVGPLLDLLDGDSLSSNGTPRNTSTVETGMFRNGLGMRVSARYTGSARIDGSGTPTSTDLLINDLATVDIRLFADLGQVLKKKDGLFKNMRASFRFDNIFDGRRIIADSNGDIPLSFQPLLTDPTGRYIGMEIRKLF